MAPYKFSAQAYGGSLAKKLVWVAPLAVFIPSVAFWVLQERVSSSTALLPFLSLPGLAVIGLVFVSMRKRQINIEIDGHEVRIAKGGVEGRVVNVDVVPWLMPGLGVAEGAALRLAFESGKRFSIGAWKVSAPHNAADSLAQVDCFVDAPVFANLLKVLAVPPSPSPTLKGSAQFKLIRYRPLGSALGSMVWWFGTMAFLGVFGAGFGETLMQRPWGMGVVAAVCLVAVSFGLAKTFVSSRREPPKYTLSVRDDGLDVCDGKGQTLWRGLPDQLVVKHETYSYRTKYGGHRFPVLSVAGLPSELRLGAWNEPSEGAAPEGAAPQYLVAATDWHNLLRALGRYRLLGSRG